MSQDNQTRVYDPSTSIVFLKTKEKFGGLSNMAPGFPLHVNGVQIRTSEALYQMCRFPHIPDLQRQILDEHSPMTAKMRIKKFKIQSRPDWDSVRVSIMRWCLRVKLAQNWKVFGDLLLSTGSQPIVEKSHKDDFWGAKILTDKSLMGMNILGRLLMELREQFRSGDPQEMMLVTPLNIPKFQLFQKPIKSVYTDLESSGPPSAINRAKVMPAKRSPVQLSLFDQQVRTYEN